MIYLFDRAKKLQKIIPRKHIINATQTKVRNGIYQLAVEVPIFYETKQGTHYNYQKSVSKAEFAGHYDDKGRFQLYKIYSRNITANEQGEFLLFDGVHIFFDEAKAMGNIHDRRFRDSEAKAPADVAFNSIGWTVIDYDVTERHDINFYRVSVTDAWNDLISTYGVEFDYELQFDGRKIISKNIIMKKQIGKWTGQRFAYGTNVLTLTQEQDESEVYTAAVGRGRGEEAGDGFGPRLEFGDIAWSKDGITKPVGQNYIELPSATAEYGFIENGIVKPRIAPEVVFEDIEDKKKLADATYYWLLENCLPKATWKTEVARIGNLELGDTVGVLYKAAGIIKRARVEKIEYNLLDPELSKLTLGDFHHFENRQMKRINAEIKRLGRDSNDRITRIKNEWNAWMDNQFIAAKNELEQAIIDANAEVKSAEVRMTEKIETERTQMEEDFNRSVIETKIYAEQQAQAKADAVKSNLESFEAVHANLYESVKKDISDIGAFLGDKTFTLREQLNSLEKGINQSIDIEQGRIDALVTEVDGQERNLSKLEIDVDGFTQTVARMEEDVLKGFADVDIRFDSITNTVANINTWHYNLLRGTRFDEEKWFSAYGEIKTDEDVNYFYFDPNSTSANIPWVQNNTPYYFVEGEEYYLSFDWQTYAVREVNYIWIIASEEETSNNLSISSVPSYIDGNNMRTFWGSEYRRVWIKFSPIRSMEGYIRIGTNLTNNDHGRRAFKIRLPYLTTTDRTQWLFHQLDNSQNMDEVINRVSMIEQLAESIRLDVQEITGDYIKQSGVYIGASGVRIGSVYLGDSQLASIIEVGNSTVDVVTEKMRITADMAVAGDIESISMSAIRGEFSKLWAAEFEATTIDVGHISGLTAWFNAAYIRNANIDKLVSQFAFINHVNALSIEAVHADLTSVNSVIMETGILKAEWIQGGTALFDRIFSSTGMFEYMTAKRGFVTAMSAVTLDLYELTIWRPDGVAFIMNGMERFGHPVPVVRYLDDEVETDDKTYWTNSRGAKIVGIAYGDHAGRYYNLVVGMGLRWDSDYATQYCNVQIRTVNSPTGINIPVFNKEITARRSEGLQWHTLSVPLGRPTYGAMTFQIEIFRRGDNVYAPVEMRYGRSWISA